MRTFRELCSDQRDIQNGVQRIVETLRKYGANRTTTLVEKRIVEVKQLWIDYKVNHQNLLDHSDRDDGSEYFVNSEYSSTEALIKSTLKKCEAYYQDLITEQHQSLESEQAEILKKEIEKKKREENAIREAHAKAKDNQEPPKNYQEHVFIHNNDEHLTGKQKLLKLKYLDLDRQIRNLNNDLRSQHPAVFYTIKNRTLQDAWTKVQALRDEVIIDGHPDSALEFEEYQERVEDVLINIQNQIELANTHHRPNPHQLIKPMKIPQFQGEYSKWRTFHDLYRSMIHLNASLGNTQKMQYLKSNISGEASRIIAHMNISDVNYETAWELLCSRYENKRLLVASSVETLISQREVKNESAKDLKALHDTTRECIHALNNLGINTSDWDVILSHLILKKMDKETARLYEQSLRSPKDLQPFEELLKFIETRFQSLETTIKVHEKPHVNDYPSKNMNSKPSISNRFDKCVKCKNEHPLYSCVEFLSLKPPQRMDLVNKEKLCKKCLKKADHNVQSCKFRKNCEQCNSPHNTLLHLEAAKTKNQSPPSDKVIQANVTEEITKSVLLPTALVHVKAANGALHVLRALIDQGSQASIITENAAQIINAPKIKMKTEISGFGAEKKTSTHSVKFQINPHFASEFTMTLTAVVFKKLTNFMPAQNGKGWNWTSINQLTLADPNYYQSAPIDLILGAEIFSHILLDGLIKATENAPMAQRTELGWILSGAIQDKKETKSNVIVNMVAQSDQEMQNMWDLGEIKNNKKHLSAEEKYCENLYELTHFRNTDGKYIVQYPFNEKFSVGNSKYIAEATLRQIERKFAKNPEFKEQYIKFINDYISMGHMSKVRKHDQVNNTPVYLPHHAVIKADSTTTKLRVVFDASRKTSNGKSLNDNMLIGPKLQDDITSIIMRWRKHNIVFKADIEKMYRQIWVDKKHTDNQRILWRENPNDPIEEYRLLTVTYGTSSAPYLAIKTLQQLASDEKGTFPEATEILKRDFYVDDLLSGANTVEEARKIQRDMSELLKKGGFHLRKWASNNTTVLHEVDLTDRELDHEINIEDNIKTLGIQWNPKSDNFSFNKYNPTKHKLLTKRILLSEVASSYDPVGWISPITIKGRILVQKLWTLKLDWDKPVPDIVTKEWEKINTAFKAIEKIKLNRWIGLKPGVEIEFHGFCDASEDAVAAVVYSKITTKTGEIKTSLLASKTKLAPLKKQTIPKLELCGALLLSRLMIQVKEAMGLENSATFLWIDSLVALSWIKGCPSRWKTYVANRVAEIQENSNISHWNYVNTSENPADIASRGAYANDLVKNNLWWNGPEFLTEKTKKPQPEIAETNEEVKQMRQINVICETKTEQLCLLSKFSSFQKLIRVTAWILRFIHNCRPKATKKMYSLRLKEESEAKNVVIKIVQNMEFEEDIKQLLCTKTLKNTSNLKSLNPFLDDNGLLRVGGRLYNSELTDFQKHQVILAHDGPLTKLIIDEAHKKCKHGGASLTASTIRQEYWILNGNKVIRSHIHKCMTCFKWKAKGMTQLMGNIPKPRLQICRAFTHTGVDYAGPFDIKTSKIRNASSIKGYIALFICLSTKAIHLELVTDLTANAFLAAYRRFTARRGNVAHMYSDNATNFVAANRLLIEATLEQNDEYKNTVLSELRKMGTEWHFIPPGAPHFGGLWEAGVKSTKYHLKRCVGKNVFTYEEYTTLLTQIEACLNSRPLSPLSSDPTDEQALTPGHFLIGGPLIAPPEKNMLDINVNRLSRWEHIQRCNQSFWKRWQEEFISRLQQRPKWRNINQEIKVGDLVLLKDEQTPPAKWPLGRIIEKHPGTDNLTRVVSVKIGNKIFKRDITKICPLPVNEPTEDKTVETVMHVNIRKRKITTSSEAINKYKNSKIWQDRNKNNTKNQFTLSSKVSLFLCTLMCCLWPAESTSYSIQPFAEPPGIYFENWGTSQLIKSNWNMMVYFNLDTYNAELNGIQNFITLLSGACENNTTNYCNIMLGQLKHELLECEHNDKLIFEHTTHKRIKRGLIDVVGNAAHGLFGLLDNKFEEQYENDIARFKQNQDHALVLIKKQTSITDATINLLRSKSNTVLKQVKHLEERMINQSNTIESKEEVTALATAAMIHIVGLQRVQGQILDILIEVHHGKVSPSLLTPSQLKKQVDLINQNLPKYLMVPEGDNLLDIYKILSCKLSVTPRHIILAVNLPLVKKDYFQILKIIPVPVSIKGQMLWIQPSTDYLMVNLEKDAYLKISKEDLMNCRLINPNMNICHINKPLYNPKSTESKCEIELLNHQVDVNFCTVTKRSPTRTWIPLKGDKWIFAMEERSTMDVICGTNVTNIDIEGSGILQLSKNCILKQPTMLIHSSSDQMSKISGDLMTRNNLTWKWDHQLKDIENTTMIITDTDNLTKQVRELQELQQESNVTGINGHHIHHYAVQYATIAIIILIVIYFINRKCKHNKISSLQQTVV